MTMCFGGDSPQQPVSPAPYPWAELDVKDSRAPETHGNETSTTPAKTPAAPTAVDSGATLPKSGGSGMAM